MYYQSNFNSRHIKRPKSNKISNCPKNITSQYGTIRDIHQQNRKRILKKEEIKEQLKEQKNNLTIRDIHQQNRKRILKKKEIKEQIKEQKNNLIIQQKSNKLILRDEIDLNNHYNFFLVE